MRIRNVSGNHFGLFQSYTDTTSAAIESITARSTGTWYHVAVVRDDTAKTLNLYVNGVLDATQVSYTGKTVQSLQLDKRLARDGNYSASPTFFNGSLDDVRIYNRALSANEVANLARGRYASGNASTSTFTLGANLSTATLALDSGNISTSNRTLTVTNALQLLRGGGNITLGSATTTLNGGLTLSGGTLTGGAGTLDVNGAVQILTGSLIAPSGTMTVSGNFTMSGGILDSNGGTVTFDGSSDQGLRLPGTSSTEDFSTLRINKSAGSVILGGAISWRPPAASQSTFSPGSTVVTAQATTIDGGRSREEQPTTTLAPSRSPPAPTMPMVRPLSGAAQSSLRRNLCGIECYPNLRELSHSLRRDLHRKHRYRRHQWNLHPELRTFTAPSITLLSGNFTNVAGTFTQGSGLFTLDGNAQTLSGSLTFYDLTKTVSSGTTLFFHAGNTVTVTNTLTLQGAASNTLKLRSTTAATQWKIDPQGTRTVSYVDIQDSWNTNATGIDCTSSNCTDSGNNTNWTFPPQLPPVVPAIIVPARGTRKPHRGGGGEAEDRSRQEPAQLLSSLSPTTLLWLPVSPKRSAKAREGSLTLPTETARKILEIREALLARFQMQLSDARKREEEREAAEAAFLEQDALATTEERRFARAQKLAQEKGSDRLSSPGKIAERRGLLSMVLGAQTVLYRDVPRHRMVRSYVSLLIEEDIAQGYKDDAGGTHREFGVANAVTRAEVLKMALEAADIPLTGGSPRNHSAQGTWASSYVAQAEAMQLSTVDPTTDVHAAATRGEVIQTIMEVMGITIGKNAVDLR